MLTSCLFTKHTLAIFIIAKKLTQSNCPSINKEIFFSDINNEINNRYTIENYSSIKINKFYYFLAWVDLKFITLNEEKPGRKHQYFLLSPNVEYKKLIPWSLREE